MCDNTFSGVTVFNFLGIWKDILQEGGYTCLAIFPKLTNSCDLKNVLIYNLFCTVALKSTSSLARELRGGGVWELSVVGYIPA